MDVLQMDGMYNISLLGGQARAILIEGTQLVERARQIGGTSAVFTFDVHPDSVVLGRQVPLLTANAYRRDEIKQLGGVDEVIFGHFDERMQHMDWRDFIHKMLSGQFGARWIISGRCV